MAVREGTLRRTGEGLLALVGLGALSAGLKGDDLAIPLRIGAVLLAIALLAPVRHRLSLAAWLTDRPRSLGRHVLSACLFMVWIAVLIAIGSALGRMVLAALLLPGLAIGFIGSWTAADVIADYCMSPQFTAVEPAGDDAAEPAGTRPA